MQRSTGFTDTTHRQNNQNAGIPLLKYAHNTSVGPVLINGRKSPKTTTNNYLSLPGTKKQHQQKYDLSNMPSEFGTSYDEYIKDGKGRGDLHEYQEEPINEPKSKILDLIKERKAARKQWC